MNVSNTGHAVGVPAVSSLEAFHCTLLTCC